MKRNALLLAGMAALMPLTMAGARQSEIHGATARHFAMPEIPLLLTRTVQRTLRDGGEIVIRRSYALRFSRLGKGFRVDGELVESTFSAPPKFGLLAQIERSRKDEGLFPILLDEAGRIVGGRAPQDPKAHEAGQRAALDALARMRLSGEIRREAEGFIRSISRSGGPAPWPADLFHPDAADRTERRHIALPGGDEGEVTVSFEAEGICAGSVPASVERTVVTEFAGTREVSRESWTMVPRQP